MDGIHDMGGMDGFGKVEAEPNEPPFHETWEGRVLADFGVTLAKDTQIRVWDSTAETRFMVVPMRPAGTAGWSEAQLAEIVTRDSMIGTGLPKLPGDAR